jgi:hypothetical protein
VEVEIRSGVLDALQRVREDALSVDLTLHMCGGLVVKDAIAFPGPSDEEAGFSRLRIGDIDLYWRQRLLVEGALSASVSDRVAPRRLSVRTEGDVFLAEAAYG